jgi:hypothetical protein
MAAKANIEHLEAKEVVRPAKSQPDPEEKLEPIR